MNKKKFLDGLTLLMAFMPLIGVSKVTDFDYSGAGISFTYDFSDLKSTTEGDTVTFECPGFVRILGEGLPELPMRLEKIEVPEGMSLGDVIITERVDTIYGVYKSSQALTWESSGEKCDTESSSLGKVWPEQTVSVMGTGVYRDRTIGNYSIMPVRYDFVNKCFLVSRELHFEIPFVPAACTLSTYSEVGSEKHSINTSYYSKRLTLPIFENNNGIEPLSSVYQPPVDAEAILIITPPLLSIEAHRLAQWKQRMGYSVVVYTAANDTYLKTPANVKSVIKSEYASNKNLEYVLLFGSGDYIRPERSKYSAIFSGTKIVPYTDYYFSCMDGDSDEFADLCIGRIPSHNLADAKTMVDKIIKYEKNPPLNEGNVIYTGDFFNTGLHISEWNSNSSKDDRNFVWTSEKIASGMKAEGFSIKRVYYAAPNVSPLYYPDGTEIPKLMRRQFFNWDGTATDITKNINNGVAYVLSRGHANEYQWTHMFFQDSTVKSLKNSNKLPIVFSLNCLSGRFYDYSQAKYSLCETLLFHTNGGAVAAIGSQDESITEYNDILSACLFEAIAPCRFYDFYIPGSDPEGMWGSFGGDPTYEIGRILSVGMDIAWGQANTHPGLPILNTNYYRFNRDNYHCLGDPAMKIYIHRPIKKDIDAIINGNSDIDPRKIIIAYEKSISGNKTYYNTAYQTNLNLWGPKLCIPGDSKISVVGDGYVPVLLEDISADGVSYNAPTINAINRVGETLNIEISDFEAEDELILYDIYGTVLDRSKANSGVVEMQAPNGISVVGLVRQGAVLDSRIVK